MSAAADRVAELWPGLAAHLWSTALVVLVLLALERVLRDAPGHWRSRLWSIGLAKLLLPAALAPFPIVALASWWREGTAAAGPSGVIESFQVILRPPGWVGGTAASDGVMWWLLPAAVWLAGSLALLARWRRRAGGFRGWRPIPITDAAAHGPALEAALERTGIEPCRVAVSSIVSGPALVGVRAPKILLPVRLIEVLDAAELAAVLLHEQAHARRRDTLRRGLEVLAAVLFWPFPFTWLVLRRLRDSAEQACDEAVLAAGIPARTYARSLAKSLRVGLHEPVLVPGLVSGSMTRRLRRIRRRHVPPELPMHRAAVALALLTLITTHAIAASESSQRATNVDLHSALLLLAGGDRVVDVSFVNRPTSEVLEELADLGGFAVRQDVAFDTRVTLQARSVPVREVLALLADQIHVRYQVENGATLIVRLALGHRVHRVGGDIQVPQRIHYVPPEYPEVDRRVRLTGVIVLEALIDSEGDVTMVRVLRGLSPTLNEAAVESVQQWKYTPTFYNGEAVSIMLTVTVQFQLQHD